MVLRGVLVVTVLLVLNLGPSHGTPLMEENESVAHHLSPEVVQQLLAVTNNTLHHVQDVKSLLTPLQENQASVDVSGSAAGVLRRDISMQLLLLLLETEQVRHSRVLEQVSQQMRGVGGRDTATSGEQCSAAINTVLLHLLQLQQEVRQLATRHPSFSTGDNTASQPQQSPSQPLQPQQPITGDNSCNTPTNRPRDCHDLLLAGNTRSGVYQIFPYRCKRQEEGVQVWCELEGEEGGWTVVLARRPLDQQVNFNRGWRDYREGFGDPDTEYWIGNAALHDLTYRWPQVLKVDLGDWDGESRSVRYQTFLVDDEDSQFRLHLGQYSGDAGDAFSYHDNMPFTTSDRDNDKAGTGNCALSHHGGFWYNSCHYVSPTSQLLEKQKSTIGINWYTWYTDRTTLKNATFMIKPKSCSY
ncbi:techylectin-5B-like isoform X2 [Homarus americanus]|uniref:Ficolin-2-like 8 n=1 Tax=Homarus americanus TaxID=6706 RepID=A0A8J5N7Y8_HOMAM|nr:techylectin-5B-like isoform X2 [Homarus americanus]KAG7175476.1 Ficolin-2-like 8 [Homarus americanus]